MDDSNILSHETEQLEKLGLAFMDALRIKEAGRLDEAHESLTSILKQEPRLAEPRMELARILLDTDRIEEAVEHARQALSDLENHGQWVENIGENTVLALAHALLAEALRRRADEDDIIFGDPETFNGLLVESRTHFSKASELDPSDAYSSYHAFFMGPEASKKKED